MDERFRALARRLAPEIRRGNVQASVDLARALVRAGTVKQDATGYLHSELTSRPLASYRVSMEPGGPDLCIVPVTPEGTVHVQIGPVSDGRGRSPWGREAGFEVLPGIAPSRSVYGGAGPQHSIYEIAYSKCLDMRGITWTRPSSGRQYVLAGSATLVVTPEGARIVNHGRRPELGFPVEKRLPRGYRGIEIQVGVGMRQALRDLVFQWAQAHPEAFRLAGREISATEVGRELGALALAEDSLNRRRQRLHDTMSGALDALGL